MGVTHGLPPLIHFFKISHLVLPFFAKNPQNTTMGKQSRRKRHRNKQDDKQNDSISSSTLVQRIRHAEPRTRHAALAALNATLLDPEELKKQKARVISPQLLQAIRERVMDNDLECSQAAAGGLANYLSFSRHRKDGITSGWTVVFMERLRQCRLALSTGEKKNRKQWLALTIQCQHALCALIETTLERVPDLVDTMMGLLSIGRLDLDARATVAAAVDEELEHVQDMTIYATRTLHSALDDNMQLLRLVSREGWDTLHSCCSQASLPLTARLHAAGCLVTAWQLLDDPNLFHECVVSTLIPLLYQTLENMPDNELIVQYVQALEQWEKQEADIAIEHDVIQTVNDRKEPPQEIAKRLKDQKRSDDDEIEKSNDVEMEHDTPDAREALERARKAWHAAVSPLQLALEIVANLTSVSSKQTDVPMEEWEQEEMSSETVDLSTLDDSLQNVLVQSGLADRLVNMLKALCVDPGNDVPADVKGDIEDLQSKCAGCLGNCLQNIPSWHSCSWKDLQSAAELVGGKGLEGVFDAMAVAMRIRPEWRKQIQQDDLDFLLKFLSSNENVTSDVVCMLGLLCSSEPHPDEVNEKVCACLLSLPCKSPRVMSEVFNALMDMYGGDGHNVVFESLDVLGYFQRMLPLFKKSIQAEQAAEENDVEQWQETLLNASRFISYQKGQL